MVSRERWTSPTTLVLHKSGHCEVVLDGRPVSLRGHSLGGEDTALGEHSHGTHSCWKQRLLCTWSPAPLHQPARSAGHAAHNDNDVSSASAVRPTDMFRSIGTFYFPLGTAWKTDSVNYTAKWSDQIAAYTFLLCSTRLHATTRASVPVRGQPC